MESLQSVYNWILSCRILCKVLGFTVPLIEDLYSTIVSPILAWESLVFRLVERVINPTIVKIANELKKCIIKKNWIVYPPNFKKQTVKHHNFSVKEQFSPVNNRLLSINRSTFDINNLQRVFHAKFSDQSYIFFQTDFKSSLTILKNNAL